METVHSRSSSTTTLVPNESDASAGAAAATSQPPPPPPPPPPISTLQPTIKHLHANAVSPRNVATASAAAAAVGPDMPQFGVGLSPQPVGREFVRQYYTVMSKSPQMLHRFYSANSTLTFCNSPTIVGQEQIRKDIEKRGLRDCHTRIFKIDAQPTLANGVVVQVVGELSNNNEPLRSFTQTFVLTPLVPKNFFVHNEIFRYQDDLQADVSLEPLKIGHGMGAVTGYMTAPAEIWLPSATIRTFSPVLTQQVIAISKSIASIAIQTANETAFKGEQEAVAVPQALQVEVVVQPLKTVAETQTQAEHIPTPPTPPPPPLSSPTPPPSSPPPPPPPTTATQQVEQTNKTEVATNIPAAAAEGTASKVNAQTTKEADNKTRHDKHESAKTTSNATATKTAIKTTSPTTKTVTKTTPTTATLAAITTTLPTTPRATPAQVTPALTYANVFKSSSAQSLIASKPTPPPLPDCELTCNPTTTYIPTVTFTTSTSGNSSPAPNAELRTLAASDNKTAIASPESSNIVQTTHTNSTSTSNTITLTNNNNQPTNSTSNQSDLRKNRYENSRNRYDSSGVRNARNNGGFNNSSGNSAYQQQRRPRQQYDRYDDNLQLFLGNLPLTATVDDLTHMFERYGSILELRVLSKSSQPGQRRLPNYGFLTFATTEAVERCLNDLPFYYPENSDKSVRLNVRPKNESAVGPQQQQQQQQQSTRSGKYNFRYDNGGDQIRSSDQSRYRRFIKVSAQEPQNGGGEASNVASNAHSSPVTVPTVKDDWPELTAASSGGGTYRKGNKK